MSKKEMVKIVDNTKKHPEERQYLICTSGLSGDRGEIVTGRTEAYEYIKDNIDDINFDTDFILVESCTLAERKSIYAFMKYVGELYDDGFDIEDYIKGDWDEKYYKQYNDIDPIIDTNERINIESFMNGDIDTIDLN